MVLTGVGHDHMSLEEGDPITPPVPEIVVSDLVATTIDENGVTTLTGNLTGEGILNDFVLAVTWGDANSPNNFETYEFTAGTTSFSLEHQYLDDNPTGTPADNVTISLSFPADNAEVGPPISATITSLLAASFNVTTSPTIDPILANQLTLATTGYAHSHGEEVSLSVEIHNPVTDAWTTVFTTAINHGNQLSFDGLNVSFPSQLVDQVRFSSDPGQNETFHSWETLSLVLTGNDPNSFHTTVTVNNVAPTLTGLSATPIVEGGATTLSGTIADVGTQDTFHVEIDWDNDGTYDESHSGVAAGTFNFAHVFLDDDPNESSADNMPINVRVSDDDGGSVTGSTIVEVTNVAPVLSNVRLTSLINENDFATLSGTIRDRGTQDTFTLTVNWGDGSPLESFSYAVGTTTFNETHQYLDDNPTETSSDVYKVSLTLSDDDGGTVHFSGDGGSVGDPIFVGSYRVNDGPVYHHNPSVYSGREAAALIFGGSFSDYAISTDPNVINHQAWYDGWGDHDGSPEHEDFKFDNGAPGYNDPEDYFAAYSAYIHDGLSDEFVNYVWRLNSAGGTPVGASRLGVLNAEGVHAVGLVGENSNSDIERLLIDHGYTVVQNPGSYSGLDAVILLRTTGSPELANFVADGGLLISEWDAAGWVLNTAHLLNANEVGGDYVETNTPITLTTSGIDFGLASGVANPYSDAERTEFFRFFDNIGDGVEILGTRPDNIPAILGGAYGSGHVLVIGYDWADGFGSANVDTQTLILNALGSDHDSPAQGGALQVTVGNVAPTLSDLSATPILENGTTTLNGTITDPGTLDTFTMVVDWGDPLSPNNIETYTFAAGTTTFSLNHQYRDDNPTGSASDNHTISLSLTDDDGGTSSSSTSVTVSNVAPILSNLTNSSPDSSPAFMGIDAVTVSAKFTDVGLLDTHSVLIHWGDGETTAGKITETIGKGTGSVSGQHFYSTGGLYTITVTLTDDDGGVAPVLTTTAVISGIGLRNGQLQIVGTNGKDTISIIQNASNIQVQAKFNATRTGITATHASLFPFNANATFNARSVTNILVIGGGADDNVKGSGTGTVSMSIDGGAGNDSITGGAGNDSITDLLGNNTIDGAAGEDTVFGGTGKDSVTGGAGNDLLFGGNGNDTLAGGVGNDVLVGGDGDDKLKGEAGRDILIGGRGKDDLDGGQDDDVNIAGFTSFDRDASALSRLRSTWVAAGSFPTRVNSLVNGTGSFLAGTGVKLKNSGDDRTVFDDAEKDTDTFAGQSGSDLFFASLNDTFKSKAALALLIY